MKKKRMGAIAAAAAIAFTAMFSAPVYAAKLTAKSVTLNVGETAEIYLTGASGKTKWLVTDGSVFGYTSGVITARSEGKAYLYAENKGKKYKCLVTVVDNGSSYANDDYSEDDEDRLFIRQGESFTIPVSSHEGDVSVSCTNAAVCGISITEGTGNTFRLTINGKSAGRAEVKVTDGSREHIYKTIPVKVVNRSSGNTTSSSSLSESEICDMVAELVNKERRAAGLKELETTDWLMAGAKKRSREISGYFSHTRPDGTAFSTVLSREGEYGENIARGQKTPEAVMKSWMNSAGHRANILADDYRYIGVGYDSKTNCWVQIFMR